MKRFKDRKSSIISKSGESTGGLLLQSTGFLKNAIPLENNIFRSSSNNNNDSNQLNFNIIKKESNNIQIFNNRNNDNKDKRKENDNNKDNKENKDNDDDESDDNILKESKISQIVTE